MPGQVAHRVLAVPALRISQVRSVQVRSLTVYLSSHVSESVMSTSTSEAGSAGRRQLSILGGGSLESHSEKLGESLGTR